MLKLRKCHLAAIGNRNARFSPVNLDFTGDAGAVNSVVFLEMAAKDYIGGLSLFDALARAEPLLAKKSQRLASACSRLSDARATAYCVLECETRIAGVSEQPIIRIIGQVLQRRDATDRSPVQRHFFTFLPCEGLNFDDLPIHGINSRQTSLSIDDFRAWLREQRAKFQQRSSGRGVPTKNTCRNCVTLMLSRSLFVCRWISTSARAVSMTTSKSTALILEGLSTHFWILPCKSAKADETVAVLQTFLSEWLNIGHLEDETLFCEEFASSLGSLSDAQTRWTKAHET